jgi:HAD superfamily hydrolase (TIGR01509 family)
MIKGFIFDMDGTMVDNMMIHHYGWQRILAEYGLDMTLKEVVENCHGKNVEIIERLFPNRYTLEERERISFEKESRYREIFLTRLKLVDGLNTFLKKAFEKGIPLSIGTAAPPENVDFVLDNLNIRHYFNAIIKSNDVNLGKPHPEVYIKAAAGIDTPLSNCLVFEDSPTGAHTAMNAGCFCIIVTTTHKIEEFSRFPNVKRFIADFTEITPEECINIT